MEWIKKIDGNQNTWFWLHDGNDSVGISIVIRNRSSDKQRKMLSDEKINSIQEGLLKLLNSKI